jgi:hypothetical protein
MKLDPEERVLSHAVDNTPEILYLTAEDIDAIDRACQDPPSLTEHMLAAIRRYKQRVKN